MLYRETDTIKIKNSMDSIYNLYRNSLAYYEKWTGIPHPFQNMGWLLFLISNLEHGTSGSYPVSKLYFIFR